MPDNRTIKWGGAAILFLIFANVVCHIYWNWGLITVKVHDAPLGKVINSIEWQGWVKIYTNLPPDAKVSMYVDHVPLAEAMETLAANVDGRPVGADRPRDGGNPGGNGPGGTPPPSGATPPSATPPPADTAPNTNAPAGTPPGGPAGIAGGGPGAGGPPGGGPGGGRPGRGGGGGGFGGGFGGGAQWNLAFFVAPTSAQVKAEIQAFQSGSTDDDTRVYTYPTPFMMVASDSDLPAADPRLQKWPGYKAPDPSATPPTPDAQAAAGNAPAAPPANANPTVQTYLQAFAESSNIWIMTPGSWAPDVAKVPPPNSSIIRAIKDFVSNTHGAVTEAIVLWGGRGARGGSNRGGGFGDMDAMADRMTNAINGLPEDARAGALDQLKQEVTFFQSVQAAPADQRSQMVRDHMAAKMANDPRAARFSPEKRAQRYARAVSNREQVRGK